MMYKKYYGVYDLCAGLLRVGFVYPSYEKAIRDVAIGIMEVTNDPEILELDEYDYETIVEMHNFKIVEIPRIVAKKIKDQDPYFVSMDRNAFYYGDF